MKTVTGTAVAILAVTLAACQSGLDRRYLDATSVDGLVLPPDLARFEVESAFELPPSFSGDDPDERNRIPVLAKVEGVRLAGSGDLYWLEVDEPVTEVYRRVKNFWAAEGFRLVVDEPVIGVMQTEWLVKEEGAGKKRSDSWFKSLFAEDNLSATQDQFRTRVERNPEGSGSRVFIAHRGTEYAHVVVSGDRYSPGDIDDNIWRFRQPEPELEVEMLSRLMIRLGLDRDEVERQVAGTRLFAPRSTIQIDSDENSPFLLLRDSYQIGWNRVYHELERLNFPIVDAEFKSGLSGEGYITFESRIMEAKKGGLFSLGSSEPVAKKFILVLSEETHELTRVEIENEAGELDTTPEGAELLTLLHQQLR